MSETDPCDSSVKTAGPKHRLETVSRACSLLKAFADEREAVTLAELSRRTGLEKTIAFRLVHTLEEQGLLNKVDSRHYSARFRILDRKRFRIGYAAQTAHSPFSAAVTESLRWAARRSDVDLIEVDNRYSARTAIRNAEHLVAQNIDLAIEFQTYEKIAPVISSRFTSANIPLVAIEIPHPGAIYFGTDNYRAGLSVGRALARAAKQYWNGEVDEMLLLELNIAGSLPHLRVSGAETAVREAISSNYTIHHLDTRGEFLRAFDAVRRHLQYRPPRRTLITGVNDPSILGALGAFEEAGRGAHCLGVGLGAILEARRELRRPGTRLVCTLAQFPEEYGEGLIQLSLDILQKRQVPACVYTPFQMVTPGNVDKFYPSDLDSNAFDFGLR